VGSNPTQCMDVCVCVYSVFVLSCVLVAALLIPRPSGPTVGARKITNLKKRPRPNKGL
jgi:hypothetical protein